MNEKSSNQCEHSLERSKSIVDIFCAVFGILLTLSQISIAMTSYQLAARAEALSFQLQAVEGHYQYEIIEDGNISSIPAPSLRLSVEHGALRAVTLIQTDGVMCPSVSTLPMQSRWDGCSVDIAFPPDTVLVEGDLIYDYAFLFLEPAEGDSELLLVYCIVSRSTQAVQTCFQRPVSLLRLDAQPNGAMKQMLSVYRSLLSQLSSLQLLEAS